AGIDTELDGQEILAKVAEAGSKSHSIAYSGVRRYWLRNHRIEKPAVVLTQVTYRPDTGKSFKVLQKSGSPRLLEIVEKLFASEIEMSTPARFADFDISPANYDARFIDVNTAAGRNCYTIELIPKRKSKYLIKGRAWIDRGTFGIMRLDGVTAAS